MKFFKKLPKSEIKWQNEDREECNKIIDLFNNWQLNGSPYEQRGFLKRNIEFGKQTISTDSEISHEILDQMKEFLGV